MTNNSLVIKKLRQLKNYFKFISIKFLKYSNFAFKKSKKLEKLSIDYYKNWRFENSFLLIDFKFKNGIWYKINEIKGFDFSKPVILDLSKITSDSLNLEVFGFFQKQVYKIDLIKEAEIQTENFKTSLSDFSSIKLIQKSLQPKIPKIELNYHNPIIQFDRILVKNNEVKISFKQFKKENYL